MPYAVVWLFTAFGVSGVVGMVVSVLVLLAVSVLLLPVEMRASSLEEAESDGASEPIRGLARGRLA